MNRRSLLSPLFLIAFLSGCSSTETKETAKPAASPSYFKVDPGTAGTLTGIVRFAGRKPPRRTIEMNQDPECARLHKNGRITEESIIVNTTGGLANVFVYLKSGLEGKTFEVPATPVTIDQKGCWFAPRVVGIQTGQTLRVTNSDPITHNIHPLAQVNREWNQSQAQGDPPLSRRFVRPEILIPVKCNIHRWMRAFIGVVEHPYFAVTGANGSFEIGKVPPGSYTIAAIHEALGNREQALMLNASEKTSLNFTFEGK